MSIVHQRARGEGVAMIDSQDATQRLVRWTESRPETTNIRLVGVIVSSIASLLAVVTLIVMTTKSDVRVVTARSTDVRTEHPAFGVAGRGQEGACAEIASAPDDPVVSVDCAVLELRTESIDLDYIDAPRSPDLLVENGFLRAGPLTYFELLGVETRPSYATCHAGPREKRYWLRLVELSGRTLCVHTDESRIAVIQAEGINAEGNVVAARLTMWNKS